MNFESSQIIMLNVNLIFFEDAEEVAPLGLTTKPHQKVLREGEKKAATETLLNISFCL